MREGRAGGDNNAEVMGDEDGERMDVEKRKEQ